MNRPKLKHPYFIPDKLRKKVPILVVSLFVFMASENKAEAYRSVNAGATNALTEEDLAEIIIRRKESERKFRSEGISQDEAIERGLVYVEPINVLPPSPHISTPILPYSARRSSRSLEATVTYSFYSPSKYESSFADPLLVTFDGLYGNPDISLLEFSMGYMWNLAMGSIGGEVGIGRYSTSAADNAFGDLELDLIHVRLGSRYTMSTLFLEPYIAPYIGAGAYLVSFTERSANNSFNGNTTPAPYWYIGSKFQIDWLDKKAAMEAYKSSGIENTFLFVEARQYISSEVDKDPDFSSDVELSMGLSLEF